MASPSPAGSISAICILFGVATIIISSWVIHDYHNSTRYTAYHDFVACASGALAVGLIQAIGSFLMASGKLTKVFWIWIHCGLVAALIVCFAIPLNHRLNGTHLSDAYFGIVGSNFIFLALAILWLQFKE